MIARAATRSGESGRSAASACAFSLVHLSLLLGRRHGARPTPRRVELAGAAHQFLRHPHAAPRRFRPVPPPPRRPPAATAPRRSPTDRPTPTPDHAEAAASSSATSLRDQHRAHGRPPIRLGPALLAGVAIDAGGRHAPLLRRAPWPSPRPDTPPGSSARRRETAETRWGRPRAPPRQATGAEAERTSGAEHRTRLPPPSRPPDAAASTPRGPRPRGWPRSTGSSVRATSPAVIPEA